MVKKKRYQGWKCLKYRNIFKKVKFNFSRTKKIMYTKTSFMHTKNFVHQKKNFMYTKIFW